MSTKFEEVKGEMQFANECITEVIDTCEANIESLTDCLEGKGNLDPIVTPEGIEFTKKRVYQLQEILKLAKGLKAR